MLLGTLCHSHNHTEALLRNITGGTASPRPFGSLNPRKEVRLWTTAGFVCMVCYADGRRSKFLVQETRTRILVQEICPCVISSRASFFSYEKLGWIRTMFYSVRETWSHVTEMLRRYWLEVRFVFFTIFCSWLLLVVSYFFRLFGHFVDYRLLSGKK